MKSISNIPSFSVISSAVDGNEVAIQKVLKHYDAYISKACLRPLYDEYGNIYLAVDMELKGRVRSAIMQMVMNFSIEVR